MLQRFCTSHIECIFARKRHFFQYISQKWKQSKCIQHHYIIIWWYMLFRSYQMHVFHLQLNKLHWLHVYPLSDWGTGSSLGFLQITAVPLGEGAWIQTTYFKKVNNVPLETIKLKFFYSKIFRVVKVECGREIKCKHNGKRTFLQFGKRRIIMIPYMAEMIDMLAILYFCILFQTIV